MVSNAFQRRGLEVATAQQHRTRHTMSLQAAKQNRQQASQASPQHPWTGDTEYSASNIRDWCSDLAIEPQCSETVLSHWQPQLPRDDIMPWIRPSQAGASQTSPAIDHLSEENQRLSEQLAAAERSRRRCVLEAQQQKADFEQDLASLQELVTTLLDAEPSLWGFADAAGLPVRHHMTPARGYSLSARAKHTSTDQDLQNSQQHSSRQVPQLVAEVKCLTKGNLELAADNRRLNQLSHDLKLKVESVTCDKLQLAEELARVERERRRLSIMEAQTRVELEQALKQNCSSRMDSRGGFPGAPPLTTSEPCVQPVLSSAEPEPQPQPFNLLSPLPGPASANSHSGSLITRGEAGIDQVGLAAQSPEQLKNSCKHPVQSKTLTSKHTAQQHRKTCELIDELLANTLSEANDAPHAESSSATWLVNLFESRLLQALENKKHIRYEDLLDPAACSIASFSTDDADVISHQPVVACKPPSLSVDATTQTGPFEKTLASASSHDALPEPTALSDQPTAADQMSLLETPACEGNEIDNCQGGAAGGTANQPETEGSKSPSDTHECLDPSDGLRQVIQNLVDDQLQLVRSQMHNEIAEWQQECSAAATEHKQLIQEQCLQLRGDAAEALSEYAYNSHQHLQVEVQEAESTFWCEAEEYKASLNEQHYRMQNQTTRECLKTAEEYRKHLENEVASVRRQLADEIQRYAIDCQECLLRQTTSIHAECSNLFEQHQANIEQAAAQVHLQSLDACSEHFMSQQYELSHELQHEKARYQQLAEESCKTAVEECIQLCSESTRQFSEHLAMCELRRECDTQTTSQLHVQLFAEQQFAMEQRVEASLDRARAHALHDELQTFVRRVQRSTEFAPGKAHRNPASVGMPQDSSDMPWQQEPQTVPPPTPPARGSAPPALSIPVLHPKHETNFGKMQAPLHSLDAASNSASNHSLPGEVVLPVDCASPDDSFTTPKKQIVVQGPLQTVELPSTSLEIEPHNARPTRQVEKLPACNLQFDSFVLAEALHQSTAQYGMPPGLPSDPIKDVVTKPLSGTSTACVGAIQSADQKPVSSSTCQTQGLDLAEEVFSLWREEQKLTAGVAAARYVRDLMSVVLEREAAEAAEESIAKRADAAQWRTACSRADARRAKLEAESLQASETPGTDTQNVDRLHLPNIKFTDVNTSWGSTTPLLSHRSGRSPQRRVRSQYAIDSRGTSAGASSADSCASRKLTFNLRPSTQPSPRFHCNRGRSGRRPAHLCLTQESLRSSSMPPPGQDVGVSSSETPSVNSGTKTMPPSWSRPVHRRVRSSCDGLTSPSTLQQAWDSLTPHRPSSQSLSLEVDGPPLKPALPHPQPRSLVEAFFVVDTGQGGAPEARFSWPSSIKGGRLEKAVVIDGFCPNPTAFRTAHPEGFNAEPFVFALLETTLDPGGDPSGVLFGCVCGEFDGAVDPTADRPQRQETLDGTQQAASGNAGVLCLVSTLPLFGFLFRVLGLLRDGLSRAAELLDRLKDARLGEQLASQGIDVADLVCGVNKLQLQIPRPLLCDWTTFAEAGGPAPLSAASHSFAQWQAAWTLGVLLARFDNLVGDTLAKLLACVLLEQKVLLLGDALRISTVALLLRALVWPFRWLHPFLPAPPPPGLLQMPLLETPFPIILALNELPPHWGYETPYALPPDVVAGLLKHDYIHISSELETCGGLRGASIKLPAGNHTAFLRQAAQAKHKFRKKDLDLFGAVEVVQEAAESEVRRLANLVRRYASAQVSEACAKQNITTSVGGSYDTEQPKLEESCNSQASDVEVFMRWLSTNEPEHCSNPETRSFYATFFQTQLCLDFLNEEILAQTSACTGNGEQVTKIA